MKFVGSLLVVASATLWLTGIAFTTMPMAVSASIFPSSFGIAGGLDRSSSSSSMTFSRRHLRHQQSSSSFLSLAEHRRQQAARLRRQSPSSYKAASAMAIPGYGVAEQVFVGGFANFLQIYNLVITGRILLSWFPQAQGIAILQPVFAVTDPYLNLFRGLIPPIFGLDLSPLLAFFLLNALGSATAALGADIPDEQTQQQSLSAKYSPFPVRYRFQSMVAGQMANQKGGDREHPNCLNY